MATDIHLKIGVLAFNTARAWLPRTVVWLEMTALTRATPIAPRIWKLVLNSPGGEPLLRAGAPGRCVDVERRDRERPAD